MTQRGDPRERRVLWLLASGVLVSVVHYVDNVVNYDSYPQADGGLAPARRPIVVVGLFEGLHGLQIVE